MLIREAVRRSYAGLLVVTHDLDVVGSVTAPPETDAPLPADSGAVLSAARAKEVLKAIGRRDAKVGDGQRPGR